MTDQPPADRKDAALRDLHAAVSRIRNLDRTPPQADPDSSTGRAYALGWQAALAAVDTALLDTPTSHDTGPSVREAAADDRRWFDCEKGGE